MAEATLNDVLNQAAELSLDDQEMLIDILRRRCAEAWRKKLGEDIRQARRDYRAGKLKAESVDELIERLHHGTDAVES